MTDGSTYSLGDSNSHHWELLQVCSVADDGQLEWNGNDDGDCCWYSAGPDAVKPPSCAVGSYSEGRRKRPASSSSSPKRESLPLPPQPSADAE